MDIGFLGTGRMGTELALHLVGSHRLTVWNRHPERASRLAEAGASVVDTAADAARDADVVITCLFGPDAVQSVVVDADVLKQGQLWLDATTIAPADADRHARWARARGIRYAHTPVVGSLAPARAGTLGVYVGSEDAEARRKAVAVVRPWADPERLRTVASAAGAAGAKLLANLALAVSLQGLREAVALGVGLGLGPGEVVDLLDATGLSFIANMKGDRVRAARFGDADFTVDALAKDVRLMQASTDADLPATGSALASLEALQAAGKGECDVSAVVGAAGNGVSGSEAARVGGLAAVQPNGSVPDRHDPGRGAPHHTGRTAEEAR